MESPCHALPEIEQGEVVIDAMAPNLAGIYPYHMGLQAEVGTLTPFFFTAAARQAVRASDLLHGHDSQ